MKNFKINKNQPPLSEADIAKGKDFGQLIKAYKAAKIPFYKTPKIWIGASAVLVASVAVLLVFSKMNKPEMTRPFINSPMPMADIKSAVYILNAQADSVITYPSGSIIHVPANAFRDKKGNIIKGNVELQYREFNKPIDVFLAGIPMTYDSAGQQFTFETAGMMEISASQNGECLKPNPEALLKVDMVSNNKDDRFNTYYLDTTEKKWKYREQVNYNPPLNIDEAQRQQGLFSDSSSASPLLAKAQQSIALAEKEITTLEQQKPIQPKKEEKSKPRFKIKVDEAEFPEIAVYKNVKFQVEDASYKQDKADIVWSDIELKRIPNSLKYRITFISPTEKYTVVAIPVFGDQDYASAKSVYDEKYKEYEAALNKKRADEARMKEELLAKEKAQREEEQKQQKLQAEQAKQYEDNYGQANLVYRSFHVSEFGFWNSDHPCTYPAENTSVKLVLIDGRTKKRIDACQCYQVEKGRNILFNYLEDGLQKFSYSPNKEYGIWVVTEGNRLAVAKYNEFKAAKRKGDELELEVNLLDKTLKTSDEVKHYLEL